MAGQGKPGPLNGGASSQNSNQGTRPPSSAGQPTASQDESYLSRAMHGMESAVARAADEVRTDAKSLRKEVRGDVEGAYCIYVAGKQARLYAFDAMAEETGYQFETLKAGFLPGLLYTLKVVGATTVFGAGVGGLVGFFGGAGAGAAPGIVVGGEIGFEVATAALSWAGLGFLVVEIAEGFDELYETLHDGVEWAWEARYAKGGAQHDQLDRAAHKIAKSAGIVVRLALQGILAWLLKKGAMSSTRRALTVGGRIGTQGIGAAADASIAELVAKIRVSKLGPDFAKWVEDHWEDLKNNPKLKPKPKGAPPELPGGGQGDGGGGSSQDGGGKGSSSDKPQSGSSASEEAASTEDQSAASVKDKLDRYLLNLDHEVGGPKAKWFKQALGFDKSNAGDLASQIKFNPKTAVQTGVTEFGTKYNQTIPIKGANGRVIDVTFAWIKRSGGIPRLVTAIPAKK